MEVNKKIMNRIDVLSIDYIHGTLYLGFAVSGQESNTDSSNVYIITNDHEEKLNFKEDKSGQLICSIKVFDADQDKEIRVIDKNSNDSHNVKMIFGRPEARLSSRYKSYYWRIKNRMIVYSPSSRVLKVSKTKRGVILKREIRIIQNLFKMEGRTKRKFLLMGFRLLYWLTKPYYSRKKIWIYFDKIYKGGDNGEYQFLYGLNQNDDIKHYYVLNENSHDYKRLKQHKKHLLQPKSLKLRLLVLHATQIFETHSNVYRYLTFEKNARKFYSNLFNANIAIIFHGLIIPYLPGAVGRMRDNSKLVCCASNFEKDNLMLPEYNYDEDMVKVLGAPRFDGLKSDPKKKILISPTWRRELVSSKLIAEKKGRGYYTDFKNSDYCRIYTSLINNEKLNQLAVDKGYEILFLLHPALAKQKKDFKSERNAKILRGDRDVNYEKLLTESDIMITDYSGIQFDFSYMKKPVLYYHPEALPPHYQDGQYSYEENGFGPIFMGEEQLVDGIIDSINKNCEVEDFYIKRIEDFYTFTDLNNCKRIYEEVTEING